MGAATAIGRIVARLDARLPARRDLLFSLKTAFAGLLALFIAFRLQLEQPEWAMMTVYIVSQPLAGMLISKGVYRILGTLAGSAAALTLVGLAAQIPELFIPAIALWLGVCAAGATVLRSNRSYGFVLAGYTALIIGFPAAQTPSLAFDLAVARATEIILGILVASAVNRIVFPQYVRTALPARLRSALPGVAGYAARVLRGAGTEVREARRRLIGEALALEDMTDLSAFEAPELRRRTPQVRHFIGGLLSVLSSALAVHDHMERLETDHADRLLADLAPVVDRVAGVLERLAADPRALDDPDRLDRELAEGAELIDAHLKSTVTPDRASGIDVAFHAVVLGRLWTMVADLRDCIATHREIVSPRGRLPAAGAVRSGPALHVDYRRAAVNGLRAAIALLMICAIWIVTAWPNGLTAVVIVGVLCSLFASRDNPVAVSREFIKGAAPAALAAFCVSFLVLPHLSGFPLLAAALFPFLFGAGLAMVNPRMVGRGTAFGIFFISLTAPRNAMGYDPAAFLNNAMALFTGMAIAVTAYAVIFPSDRRRIVDRLIDGMIRELRRLAADPVLPRRRRFEHRMYDRINLLLTGAPPAEVEGLLRGGLAALTVGLEMARLRRLLPQLPDGPAGAVRALLSALSAQLSAPPGTAPAAAAEAARRTEERLFAALGGGGPVVEAIASARLIGESLAGQPGAFTRRGR
ncbi:FUSC family protein [Azospirillum thermophilum]|uniref:FUSC family protein n=1 Tax=Azospirillum thermophilum TaxID=2202148 RepID=A0A2S2CVM4_9PROT|nr:FUSC family protein [Azospirillum thermophilum]AWK88337.1 hypothetical protein DEW08_19805 [Azospirillum thermophilum]